jgi:hypothetical protein
MAASPSANPLEVQDSTGVAKLLVKPTGSLQFGMGSGTGSDAAAFTVGNPFDTYGLNLKRGDDTNYLSLYASQLAARIALLGYDASGYYFRATTAGAVVGPNALNASAVLQADSTTKGFLPPRMTTTQRDAITSPPEGLEIYNLTTHKKNVYTGSAWEQVTSA